MVGWISTVIDMIGSLGTYDVMRLYRCFGVNTLGFGNLRGLVELERLSSDGLVMGKWVSKSSRWFLSWHGMDISYWHEEHIAYCDFLLDEIKWKVSG